MNLLSILLVFLGMLILYFGIHLVINRGKIKFDYLVIAILYSFAIGVPVAYYSGSPDKFMPVFYVIYYTVFLLPFFGYEFYKCFRGRQTWGPFLLIFIGIILILLSPVLEHPVKFISILSGLALISGYFFHLFRYPHLNAMWLADMAKKAAENIEKDCRYSPKPVIVTTPSKKTSCTSAIGLYLLFKKNRSIVRMSKDFHQKLGRPNMEEYAKELVKRIKKKTEDEGKTL
ncbi:MAG: hypothetical protein JSV17_01010 [Candidatus Aminicenantes bacterium]|nr:MAG: hypothetical protein JSV17_01010 [Candidatus Aminicenantes bacterium]